MLYASDVGFLQLGLLRSHNSRVGSIPWVSLSPCCLGFGRFSDRFRARCKFVGQSLTICILLLESLLVRSILLGRLGLLGLLRLQSIRLRRCWS